MKTYIKKKEIEMREHVEVHHDRVMVPSRPYSSHPRGPVDVSRALLEALQSYETRDLIDAMSALQHLDPHPHRWTTAGEIARLNFAMPVTILWHEVDYDYESWETMDVVSTKTDDEGRLWFYNDVEELKAYYSNEYPEHYSEYSEDDWIEMARSDRSFYDAQPVLVLEKHPTLF